MKLGVLSVLFQGNLLLKAWKKVKRIRWVKDPRYVQSEGIKILALLIILGSLGKKLLLERFGRSNIEEWLKYSVVEKKRIERI